MTTTIRWCDGAEAQDLTWLLQASGSSPSSMNSTTNPRTGIHHYRASTLASGHLPLNPNGLLSGGTSITDAHIIVGFSLDADSVPSSGERSIFQVKDSLTAGDIIAELLINPDSSLDQVILKDAAGTTLLTVNNGYKDDEYVYIELYFEHVGSSASWELKIDGDSKGSGSSADFTNTGEPSSIRLIGGGGANNYDDFYVLSDDTSKPTFLGPAEVFAFQAGSGATEAGTLGSGSITNIDDLPHTDASSDEISMDQNPGEAWSVECDAAGEGAAGPRSNSDIDGDSNIKLVVWHHQLKRTNGGSPDSMHALYGNDTDTIIQSDDILGDLTTAYQDFFNVSEDETDGMPLSTEDMAYGLEVVAGAGGRDLFASGIFAQLLHVPDTDESSSSSVSSPSSVSSVSSSSSQQSFVFDQRRMRFRPLVTL